MTAAEPRARRRMVEALASLRVPFTAYQLSLLARVSPSTAKAFCDEQLSAGRLRRCASPQGKRGRYLELVSRRGLPLAAQRTPEQRFKELENLPWAAPIWIIYPNELQELGVTRRLGAFAIMGEEWAQRFDLEDVPHVTFKQSRPLALAQENLPPTELLIALLKCDVVAAGQLFRSIPRWDRHRLLRRIHQEDVKDAAREAGIPLDLRRARDRHRSA